MMMLIIIKKCCGGLLSFFSCKYIKNNSGYSILELATVIVLMAFLAILAKPTYEKSKAKARRVECLTMLSGLKAIQQNYINSNNGKSYNAIHCPKLTGFHTRLITGETKNVLVLDPITAKDFCDPSLAKVGPPNSEGATTYDDNIDTQTLYAYAFQACAADELHSSCPGNIEMADVEFPALSGNSYLGFAHPAVALTTLTWTDIPPLVWPNKGHHFLVKCEGNIDNDAFSDLVVMDNIGTTFVKKDDLNDTSYP